MPRVLLSLILLLPFLPAQAVLVPDPGREWQSADSTHFRVNYVHQQRVQAEEVADIAERAYARLSKELKWVPENRIEIVLLDEFDISNGYSFVIPFPETSIYLTPPNEGELLDNSVWLEMLITHELTHTFHLDKARSTPDGLRSLFGRFPLLFPNEWQPTWAIEGIATYNESTPEAGRGRLRGPIFEAWMRVEQEQGFKSLTELNADGRALPTSKQYLYGVYFYDFLARKYGPASIYNYIDNFSGNLVPRVHTNPVGITGKYMDELWEEFITDLQQQIAKRSAQLKATPRNDGSVILPAHFSIDSLAPAADGSVLAVADGGLLRPKLWHIDAQGQRTQLTEVNAGTQIDQKADGTLLLAQPDICNNHSYYYDLYTWRADSGQQRLTHCARYRRAVWLGDGIAALHIDGGKTRLDLLQVAAGNVQLTRSLYETPSHVEAIDLAASPDGQRIALAIKQAGAWQVLEFDASTGAQRVVLDYNAPLLGLRYARDGRSLEFIALKDNVYNLWRYTPASKQLTRLSHTYTATLLHSGIAQDGSVTLAVLAPGGTELRRMAPASLEQTNAAPLKNAPLPGESPVLTHPLGNEENYHAWNTVYPRTWFPALLSDRGLTAYGASTFGSDAMGWHNYSATLMWETSQHEALGNLSYSYLGNHLFSATRNLRARQWTSDNTTTIYDRETSAQWVSMLPWLQIEQRVHAGIGTALQTTDRVWLQSGTTTKPQNERVAAAFLRYDTRNTNWYADSFNRGNLTTLLYESYRPLDNYYSGDIVRFDTKGLLPLGKTVLSGRWTEAHASGVTEPFQLGGAFDHELTQAPYLNQRSLPLRGYSGSEAALYGQNARSLSVEWRVPVADVDSHFMSPPVGMNRLSATVFMDAGSVWNNGQEHSRYYRGVGAELVSECVLYYRVTLPLRLGYAHALDDAQGNRWYLLLGLPF